ncbi:hypothetical protein [Indibacter alkaliphilus]|uniref:hypothetical protein n=1 Tax=Indibacter alkaliphilus TaxID=579922 RepID=UPI000282422B|nr:hypothetical protein [Indibacter alkaliphilus]
MKQKLALMLVTGMTLLASCGNKSTEDAVQEPVETEQTEHPEVIEEITTEDSVLEVESDTLS